MLRFSDYLLHVYTLFLVAGNASEQGFSVEFSHMSEVVVLGTCLDPMLHGLHHN